MDRWLEAASVVGAVAAVLVLVVAGVRMHRSSAQPRTRVLWLTWGAVVTGAVGSIGLLSALLVDWPAPPGAGFAVGCLMVPATLLLGRWPRVSSTAEPALVHTLVVSGLAALVGGVYVLVVVGLGRIPQDHERTVLALSAAAALVSLLLAFPARRRLVEWANQRVYGERHAPEEALRTFGGRMSRAVPLDELLLQLGETLRTTMHLTAAEIWTGTEGRLSLTVAVPERRAPELHLDDPALPVATRAHAQGNAWLQVWAPELLTGREERVVRSVSVAHLGELLGLIVVERAADGPPFTEEEDRVLVDLARQVGLALHNVRLDSALQASMEQLRRRNEELVASRARIVAAADESRRTIERDLHDGAQQHLVALAVKIGLIKLLLATEPERATTMLDELREDVQATLTELRELSHGIYPPLLRERGLAEALQTAARRASLPTQVCAGSVGRYDRDVEAAVYFCCLEAVQNAGKHAGSDSTVSVTLGNSDGSLWFEVTDDGVGFDPAAAAGGHGFVNMADRLGAFGGELSVTSSPGHTTVRGELPLRSRSSAR